MRSDLNSQNSRLGICVKSQDGTVISQNAACQSECGNQIGLKCESGCMAANHMRSASNPMGLAVEHLKNIKLSSGGQVDAVMINDGTQLVTLLLDKLPLVEAQLQVLQSYPLTTSEVGVIKKHLLGHSHKQISQLLFISRSTLKTHLNNIFKKLPTSVADTLRTRHRI